MSGSIVAIVLLRVAGKEQAKVGPGDCSNSTEIVIFGVTTLVVTLLFSFEFIVILTNATSTQRGPILKWEQVKVIRSIDSHQLVLSILVWL